MKKTINLSDTELVTPKKRNKKLDPRSGPNGLSAKISRDQVLRQKTMSVSLRKMPWEK